jgi:WD40 repeat protein
LRVAAQGTGGGGMTLSSDGEVIAVAHGPGTVGVVEADSLRVLRTARVLRDENITRLAFVPGRHLVVVTGERGGLALLDADSGRVTALEGHETYVLTPGLAADGRLLVTAEVDGIVRFWSLPDGRPAGRPLRFPDGVYDAQLSPDGRRLVLVLFAADGVPDTLEVRDVASGRRIARVRAGDNTNLVRFSPDGRLAVVGNNSGRAQVWSTKTWRPVSPSVAGHAGALNGAAISTDGRTLATGGDDGTVRLWAIRTGEAVGAPLPGVAKRSVVPSFTPDGHLLASYETGDAYLWDIRPERLVAHACRVAGRRLTRAEWNEFLGAREFEPAC